MTEEIFTIGKIINAQGIRGEVKVLPMTEFPERFDTMDKVRINNKGRISELTLEGSRAHKNFIFLKFKEINTMNDALTLKDSLIQVTRDELVPLPEGRYYIFDLIDLPVYTVDGELLGHLKDVFQTGSNDVYTVKTPEGKEVLLPAIPQVIKDINLTEKKIVVELMEGLI